MLASVPSIMGALRSRCVSPEWARRVEVLQEQLSESIEGKARPPAASDLVRMRPHTAKTAQIDSFAFSVKVRNEAKTFIDLCASGLNSSATAYIKVFRLDIEVIFSKDPFLVAGRDNAIAAGSMFAAVVPHAVIEEQLEPDAESDGAASICKVVELPTPQSSSCFFLAVECNGIKTGQTVFKRYLDHIRAQPLPCSCLTRPQSHGHCLCGAAGHHHCQVRELHAWLAALHSIADTPLQ